MRPYRNAALCFRGKLERRGIDTITQMGGLGSIVEHVPQMSAAVTAFDLYAPHPETVVLRRFDVLFRDGRPKAGPTAPRIKLGFRAKQLVATTDTFENTRLMGIPIFAREGTFGALLPGDVILLRRKLFPPLFFGLFYFVTHNHLCMPFSFHRNYIRLS